MNIAVLITWLVAFALGGASFLLGYLTARIKYQEANHDLDIFRDELNERLSPPIKEES